MASPYRELAATGPKKEKKQPCILFHDWEINLKPDSLSVILKDSKKVNGRKVYFVDIFQDYNLKCSACEKEKEMTTNPVYWQMALEDAKKRFYK